MTFDPETAVYEALRKKFRQFTPLPTPGNPRSGEASILIPSLIFGLGGGGYPSVVWAPSNAVNPEAADIPLNGSDDSAVILNKIYNEDKSVVGGRWYHFLGGIINCITSINLGDEPQQVGPFRITGAGVDQTIFQSNALNIDMFRFGYTFNLRDVTLDGNDLGWKSWEGASASQDSIMWDRVRVHHFLSSGLDTQRNAGGPCTLVYCNFHDNDGHGVAQGREGNLRIFFTELVDNGAHGWASGGGGGGRNMGVGVNIGRNGAYGLDSSGFVNQGDSHLWVAMLIHNNVGRANGTNGAGHAQFYNAVFGNGDNNIAVNGSTAHNMIAGTSTPGDHLGMAVPGSDGSAIHDDTPGEIAAITEKTTLVGTDLLVIEDSEASLAKKKAQVANLATKVSTFGDSRPSLSPRTGTTKWVAPVPLTVVGVRAALNTSPVGQDLVVDVVKNGSASLWTAQANQPRVVDGDGDGVGTAVVPDQNNTLTTGDYLTFNIDQTGTTTAGGFLTVMVEWEKA